MFTANGRGGGGLAWVVGDAVEIVEGVECVPWMEESVVKWRDSIDGLGEDVPK